MNNEELGAKVKALSTGDMTAFEKIYTELKSPVYTVIVRIIGDEAAAEDILQEVFIKLFRSPPTGELRNPRAYIFKMARNFAIDGIRKQRNEAPLDEIEDTLPEPQRDIALRLDVETAISRLSLAERQTVSLHINGGLKFREVAEITGEPLGTVLWRYQTAVSKLQKYLSGGVL